MKDEFKDQMINYIQLAWKLACMLRTYRTCNPTVGFSKYEFNNKLLVGVTFNNITILWHGGVGAKKKKKKKRKEKKKSITIPKSEKCFRNKL